MKITEPRRVPRYALGAPASGITIADPGGFFGSPGTLTLEELIAILGAGSAPGAFLRTKLGELGEVHDYGTIGATEVLDLALANHHVFTLAEDSEITSTGWTNGKFACITGAYIEDGTGDWLPTFTGVSWVNGAPRRQPADTVTFFELFGWDGGTTIYGLTSGGPEPAFIPMTVFDPTTGNWLPLVDGSGNQIMAAV